jgi:hypothetical protein
MRVIGGETVNPSSPGFWPTFGIVLALFAVIVYLRRRK